MNDKVNTDYINNYLKGKYDLYDDRQLSNAITTIDYTECARTNAVTSIYNNDDYRISLEEALDKKIEKKLNDLNLCVVSSPNIITNKDKINQNDYDMMI